MLSEDDISRQCAARTLQRARSIASSERNILTKQVRYNPPETTLSAFVASSSGWNDRYRTSVTFDENEGAIVDFSCTCPAYREHEGMCKHCAALALTYADEPRTFMGYRAHRAPTTSTSLLEFMERSKSIVDAEETGAVDLETTISYGYRNWSAHFKIAGPNGAYVMRSISEFVDRMRRGERFSYGKKLAFTHAPALLTEQARGIARFLDRAVALREQATGSAFCATAGATKSDETSSCRTTSSSSCSTCSRAALHRRGHRLRHALAHARAHRRGRPRREHRAAAHRRRRLRHRAAGRHAVRREGRAHVPVAGRHVLPLLARLRAHGRLPAHRVRERGHAPVRQPCRPAAVLRRRAARHRGAAARGGAARGRPVPSRAVHAGVLLRPNRPRRHVHGARRVRERRYTLFEDAADGDAGRCATSGWKARRSS